MKMFSMIFSLTSVKSSQVPLGVLFHLLISLLFQNSDRLSVDMKPNPECQTLHINCIKARMTSSVRLRAAFYKYSTCLTPVHITSLNIQHQQDTKWMCVSDQCQHLKRKLKNIIYIRIQEKLKYKHIMSTTTSNKSDKKNALNLKVVN